MRRLMAGSALALTAVVPSVASAQTDGILIAAPSIPDYDRGRNVSVVDRARPDYEPIGIRRGSFVIYPRLDTRIGITDNVYLTDRARKSDGFVEATPSFLATSDWSRHQLSLAAGASLRRYLSEAPRNQNEWYINALGRADFLGNLTLTVEGQASRNQEPPFGGASRPDIAALSSYQRRTAIVRGQYLAGRSRVTVAYDYNSFDFAALRFQNGSRVSQADRDRGIHRITGQVERAVSPSLSVFGQLSYARTDYSRGLLTGVANRDSDGTRVLAGVNFDLSAFIRGGIGVGYVERKYVSPLYRDVGGLSTEAKIEYFPSELTTITVGARRLLDDSSVGATGAFFENQARIRVDHEIRSNVLLYAAAEFAQQDYRDTRLKGDVFRISSGGRFFVTRGLQLEGSVGYNKRKLSGLPGVGTVRELTAEVRAVIQL
ncbi:MAG: hypothetical protein EOP58_01615 [Sphingomonadales bacterium]|nr:MAG: hypothetical protein EOP58_01615 [Sphingomonadales bacterium]